MLNARLQDWYFVYQIYHHNLPLKLLNMMHVFLLIWNNEFVIVFLKQKTARLLQFVQSKCNYNKLQYGNMLQLLAKTLHFTTSQQTGRKTSTIWQKMQKEKNILKV